MDRLGPFWDKLKAFFNRFLTFYKTSEVDLTSITVAYYFLVSIFPILMLLANLLPYLNLDSSYILDFLKDFFPEKIYPTVESQVKSVLSQGSTSWLGISILTTMWTLSKNMVALQKAANKAYGIDQHRDIVVGYGVGLFLGLGLQLVISIGVLLLVFGNTVFQLVASSLHLDLEIFEQWLSVTQIATYVTLVLALLLLYFFLPNVRISKIRFVLPGALFVILVSISLGQLFALYVESYANRLLDIRYISLVIVLILMVWFIFMAKILIIGAILNATVQSFYVSEFQIRKGTVMDWVRSFQKWLQVYKKKRS